MIQLHAYDAMAQAAHKAAMLVSGMDLNLLAAASPSIERNARAEALRRALTAWPAICRAMGELQEVAPNIARQAQQQDGKLQDFLEAKA